MKTKNSNQRTHQIGEQLVVSKLGKLGILATPSAGNVSDYHLLASDRSGHSLPLRVRAINRGSWQYDVTEFLEIELQGDCQVVKGEKKLPNPDLICVLVLLKPNERNEFYILPLRDWQQYCAKGFLKDAKGEPFPGGKRPRNPRSTHGAVRPRDLQQYRVREDQDWSLVTKHFIPVTGLGEPAASPNGDPAAPIGKSGGTEGAAIGELALSPKVNMHGEKSQNTNLAAEFFVASQLYRKGFIVTLTLGHTKEIDLIVAHPDGRRVTVDVKGLKYKTNWPLKPKCVRPDHFFILVSYLNKFEDTEVQPEAFVIPSTSVESVMGAWTGRPEVTNVDYSRVAKRDEWKNAWDSLFRE